MGGNQELVFGHVKFEISTRCPSGKVKKVVEYMRLALERKFWVDIQCGNY